jgi:prephenate dehydrogenase
MRELVAAGDRSGLLDTLEHARAARVNLPVLLGGSGDMRELRVPVPDRPGSLADVTTLATELDVNIADLEIAHSTEGPRGVLILLVEAEAVPRMRKALAGKGYRSSVHPVDGVS